MFKNLFVVLIIAVVTYNIYPQGKFQNLTLKNGLSSNKVYSCLKDSKGFIWFATDNGLCRYDGIRFKIFNMDDKNQPELKENIFDYIFQRTEDELLFISSIGKLYSYSYGKGKFINLSEKIHSLKNKFLTNLYKDRNNFYWFSTETGLLKTDGQFNLIGEYKIKENEADRRVSNRVMKICEDKTGIFWLGMFSRAVMRFDPKTGRFSSGVLLNVLPPLLQAKSIFTYPKSDFVFIATSGEGLLKINIHNFSYEKWKYVTGSPNSLPSDRITALCSQNDSILWVGTLEGLSQLNLKSKKIINYYNDQLNPYSLVNNNISDVYIDSQNILWVSTFGGISKLYTNSDRFIKVSQNNQLKNTISSNTVNHCIRDKFGNLWLATAKGIDVKEANGNRYYHYDLPKSFEYHKNEEIVKFFVDEDTWWIGTWGGGLSRFRLPENFKPGTPLHFQNFYYDSNDPKSLSSNFIRSFTKDKYGNLWITTWNGGLNKINSSDKNKEKIIFKRFTDINDPSKAVASNYIDGILFDSDNILWLCTSKGLQKIDFEKNSFEMFYHDPMNPGSKLNFGSSIIQDEEKNLWLSSFGGLICLKKEDNAKYSVKIIYENSNHGIYAMTIDKKGVLWFSTFFSEIGSYNTKTGDLKFYSMIEEADGFDFYLGEPTIDKEGTIYFSGNSGYLFFNLNFLPENNFIPPLYLTSIKIAGEEYFGNTDVSNIKQIELNYDRRNLSIEFAALNFVHSNKNEYKYFLEGLDKNWISHGNKTEINFANIPTGNYNLKIIGSNNDGYWNNTGITLNIIAKPPFWENNYYRLIAFAFFGLIVFLIVNSKISRLKSERRKQNLFSKLLIKSQEDERKRLAQELHDSLGQNLLVIKNQLDMYKASDEKEADDLNKIGDLIKESISEVKEISSDLHPHQLERLGLNKAIRAMINKLSSSSNLEIETKIDDLSDLWKKEDEINVYRIIQESLNNIIKHSGSKRANVEIRKEENKIFIIIEDFGKGFDFTDKELQHNFAEGLGLKSITERVRLLNGELNVESAQGEGTKILVTINYV
jgi:signal transduction histidine kinase/ligand-binding sensor domain-containing protein